MLCRGNAIKQRDNYWKEEREDRRDINNRSIYRRLDLMLHFNAT